MKTFAAHRSAPCLVLLCVLAALALAGCAASGGAGASSAVSQGADQQIDTSRYIVCIEDEPDTVDFQCTSINYTIATNVFNRLVETERVAGKSAHITPSLAESWEVSSDGRVYTFHLREGVTFSNGSPLTSSDVLYTFTRLLTHPDSCNTDIAEPILGATRLMRGETDQLEGFEVLSDQDFSITLEQPFEAFLACLSMPGASIMDEETTSAAGDRFGKDPSCTIGTGPFVMQKWEPGEGILLAANPKCWDGAPRCEGVNLRFITEPVEARTLFEEGKIDVLDLDEVGNSAEFFTHG
ncbi:MAG: ABC transporter substrate-binding protein, partial [Eggerthellaceae bacterium]|nr:ABC transporter substrate-binding protein [Eggerthellaceae bacterium]